MSTFAAPHLLQERGTGDGLVIWSGHADDWTPMLRVRACSTLDCSNALGFGGLMRKGWQFGGLPELFRKMYRGQLTATPAS